MTVTQFGFYHSNNTTELLLGNFESQLAEVSALRVVTFLHWDIRILSDIATDLQPLKDALTQAIEGRYEVIFGVSYAGFANLDTHPEINTMLDNIAELNSLGLLAPVSHMFIDEPTASDLSSLFSIGGILTTLKTLYPTIKIGSVLKGYDLATYTSSDISDLDTVVIDFYATIPAFFFFDPVTYTTQIRQHFNELLALTDNNQELGLVLQTAVIDPTSDADIPTNINQMINLNNTIIDLAKHPRVKLLFSFMYSAGPVADVNYGYSQLGNRSHPFYSSSLRQQIEQVGRPLTTIGGFGGNFLGNLFLGNEYPSPTGLGAAYEIISYFKTEFRIISSYQDVQV